jgi:hypothetical protein
MKEDMSKTLYPLGDTPTAQETDGAPFKERRNLESFGLLGTFRAVSTGEKRAPKKGEWYLSGAIATAYKAPNDLTSEYHIARLVRVRRIPERYEIVQ